MSTAPVSNTARNDRWFQFNSTRFWEHARERKWLYLVVGVLLGTLLVLAIQRSATRRAYVVPAATDPRVIDPLYPRTLPRTSDPLLNGRTLNFPSTALGNLPAYPVGDGGQVMPYVNRTTKDLVVKEAFFFAKNAGRPLIPGVATPAYAFRFMPEHFQADQRCWARSIDDLVLPAGSESRVVVHVVDPARAGQRIYGTLVLRVASGDLIQFEATQVIVQAD
jgi:hypothetical protein